MTPYEPHELIAAATMMAALIGNDPTTYAPQDGLWKQLAEDCLDLAGAIADERHSVRNV
jgi:hypothetical protein